MSKLNPIRWTTKKIQDLMIQIDKTGVIPRYNPFYNNDAGLLAGDLNFGVTEREAVDRARVKDDIFYFATTHAQVKLDDTGEVQTIKELRPYQKNLIYHYRDYRFNIVLASRQIGKCVHPFTLIIAEMDGHAQLLPIFEVYYMTRPNMSLMDKCVRLLLKTSYGLAHPQ